MVMTDEAPVSKSQRKRDAAAMFQLAVRLVELSPAALDAVTLEPAVRTLVVKVRGITRFVARKRELQFLAKQLRREDRSELLAQLGELDQPQQTERAQLHRLEAWRDFLIEHQRHGVNQLCGHNAQMDRPKLLSLSKKAAAERAAGNPPAAGRSLFRLLRDADQLQALPAPEPPA